MQDPVRCLDDLSLVTTRIVMVGRPLQEEKQRMKSRAVHDLRRRVLASTLLAVVVTAAAGAQSAPAVSPAEARIGIQAGYAEWVKARVAVDRETIEKMLAPDFYFQLPGRRVARQDFINGALSLKVTRFDESVLTVDTIGNDWSAVIFAKAEVENKDKDGKTSKGYRVLVSRDGWRKQGDGHWILLSSEVLSQQRWTERPPIANW